MFFVRYKLTLYTLYRLILFFEVLKTLSGGYVGLQSVQRQHNNNNNNNNNKIVRFCNLSMEKWNTRLILKTKQEVMQSQPIRIRREIFQGDSLSPSLFCIALIPLTNELNRADCGYQVHGTETKISHLLYMDDLKLLGRNENDLEN